MGDLVNPIGVHTKLLQEGLHTLTEDGVLGDPRDVEATRGEAYLNRLADHFVSNFKHIKP
jgi:creatinine amidohydrolase/Fe(II)-dependent formamide hydrolase-like protein